MKLKYIILGGGPSGLALAHSLLDSGLRNDEILVLEKNNIAGGLCRSEIVDSAPLDIGGGHFLDVKHQEVLDFIFRFMPRDEWNIFNRISKILIRGIEVDHPFEANLWQFPSDVQVEYLESIAQAGSVCGDVMPESFDDWIKWKLGKRIAEEYMLPYNRKIWSTDLGTLGTYWLHKLPSVSFRETLASCLEGKATGSLPAHGTFLYPKKFGYGEVWHRMGEALGDSLVTNCTVEFVDLDTMTINNCWQAENIVSTIPWTLWLDFCKLPEEIMNAIASLKKSSIDVDYYPETLDSSAHWIYEPDELIDYHRLLLRSNFVPGARGYWSETNSKRSNQHGHAYFHNEYAYPLNSIDKPNIIKNILLWGRQNKIIGLGRWGKWEHMNSDVAVLDAIRMASQLRT